jgi:phage N-6-adenine-methyltransferase
LTPKEILDSVLSVLGTVALDPCAERDDAQANVPAGAHFTEKTDGLKQVWDAETLFLNPPYSRADAFVEKLIASWREGSVNQAIALLPSRTDRGWFQDLHAIAPVCFVRGRLRFELASRKILKSGAPFPSLIFYIGPRIDRFVAEFETRFGLVKK